MCKKESLALLIDAKADLEKADCDNRTPLVLAYKLGMFVLFVLVAFAFFDPGNVRSSRDTRVPGRERCGQDLPQ